MEFAVVLVVVVLVTAFVAEHMVLVVASPMREPVGTKLFEGYAVDRSLHLPS